MAITPVELLEESNQDLIRAQGRILTALAHMKLEDRVLLSKALGQSETIEEKSVPNAEQIQHFLVAVILPVVVGAVVSLLASTEVLNVFNISHDQLAAWLSALGVFGVTTLVTWLHAHHVLSAHYSPAAKAKAGK